MDTPNCIITYLLLLCLQTHSCLSKPPLQSMIQFNDFFPLHLLLLLLPLVPSIQSSALCNTSCGHIDVPYPFGFSESCKIPLNCTDGKPQIGKFAVNVTADNILVNLPAECNRPIQDMAPLFSSHYAPSFRNGLLLQNCTTKPSDCAIPKLLLESQFMFSDCEVPVCYSEGNSSRNHGCMKFSDLKNNSCKFMYSSVVAVKGDNTTFSVSLAFQTVELRWWLEGECNCSSNAKCVEIGSPPEMSRFRCKCGEGFHGDGFVAGKGCLKDPTCNPWRYLIGKCGGNARIAVLIGGAGAGAFFVTGLAFICYMIRRRSALLRTRESTRKLLSEAAGSFTLPFYSYKEIQRATYCFAEKYRLGAGAYGTVYAGKLNNEDWVAIKKIRYRGRDGIEPMMNEIKLISSVNHPNLVHLLGFCLEKDEQILVYEFMANGTLSQHLHRERGTSLPWTIRLNIATEIAHAIAHLHSAIVPPIYHRDIKSTNILLNSNFNAKLADFGLSRFGMPETSHISTAPQGTPGYLDPQYHQSYHLSDRSDVYSFGVVLVEIITAMKAVDFSRPPSEVNLADLAVERIRKGRLNEIIDPFLEPHRDAWTLSSIQKMAELAFRCLAFHGDTRPSMTEVAAELEQIKFSGWAPLDENIHPPLSVKTSPSKGIEKSQGVTVMKEVGQKARMDSQRRKSMEKVKDWSPVSVDGPWLSEQSSPSTNSKSG